MITNTTAKSTYIIADGVTSYAVGFLFNKNPDGTPQIKLYLNNHPELPLVYGTDYTLSGDELNVVLLDNYSVGDRLHILRDIPMVQLSDYVIGRIDPEQLETDFDESVMRDQQLQAEIDLLGELPIDHERRIVAIEDVIPAEATSENQLADKAYVNTTDGNLQGQITTNKGTMDNHIANVSNPHSVTKAQVGLGNCDNTADLDKPISTATQAALDAHTIRTDNPHSVTKTQVGLGNVDNTSDANKPISTATQSALDLKANTADLGTAAYTASTLYATAAQGGKADTAVQPGELATVATSGSYNDLSNKPSVPSADTLLDALYPVGSIYIGTQATCPLTTLIPGSTWEQIQGRYLLASGTIAGTSESVAAGSTCSAGAPNTTGEITAWAAVSNPTATGAFQIRDTFTGHGWDGTADLGRWFNFNASRSSSVYGNSSTVRPAGYAVNVWRRTA